MKIMVLGAGGIIGSHMRISQPSGVEAVYTRRVADDRNVRFDSARDYAFDFLSAHNPDAVVNLAGESRPDVVERDPQRWGDINIHVPAIAAFWCQDKSRHMVQVSSQAVFGGIPQGITNAAIVAAFLPPFLPKAGRSPVNRYGLQKVRAETEVAASGKRWTIVRPTFVLGVRPDPSIGRENPVEQMLAPVQAIAEGETVATQRQVHDRWFSVSFAWDVASTLWEVATGAPRCEAIHVGIPFRTNRYILASYIRPDITIEPVSHDSFEGLAPRPVDTTYAGEGGSFAQIAEGLDRCKAEYEARMCAGVNR